SSGLIISEIIL
ncbi:secA DEAD-like domain protein, partial [Chlamydia psittaci C6/98]